ncbi:MAG: (Fe-S)-binding protein, partial [Acidobacteria bacterium]|nr:(Fe-S)-binding protein [Acidobacteriota bacterium]
MPARKEEVSSGTSSGGYGPGLAPAWEDFSKCIRCGLCLNACPTYRELGVEMDSPRGRIYQMVQVERGRLPLDQSFVRHMDSCLGCLACETACPSGVEYHKLIEAARSQIERFYKRPPITALLRRLFLQGLASPVFLKTAGLMLRWVQRLGIEAVMRRTAKLFSRRLYNITRLAPRMDRRFFFEQLGTVAPAEGERRYRVAFFAGCIANLSFSELNEATVRVLARNGCEVVIPKDQVCCGALHVHSGVPGTARSLGRRNFKAFAELVDGGKLDAIITNAAGCGSVLK